MFKKFKRRQLISNVSILTVLMLVVFSSLFLSTYNDVNSRNDSELRKIVLSVDPYESNQMLRVTPGSISFVVISENNEISSTLAPLNLPVELIEDSFDLVDSAEGKVDVEDFTFMYITQEHNGITVIGFMDVTFDEELLSSLIVRYSLIFLISVLTTFIVTYFITSKSIKPVKESYDKQREFIANASHELKTPLTVINTNVDVLLSNKKFEDNKWLKYIKSESNRMNKLTNDLLYLAKTSEVNNTFKITFNASKQLESILLGMEALAFENKIKFKYDVLENRYINFDKDQFSQLLVILLDNAIKYTPEDNEVIVTLKKHNKGLKLSIKNTGITLKDDEIKNVFERFYMSDKSRVRSRNSYGLGLSIAYEISKSNNVDLKVKSEDNYTEFYLIMAEKKETN